MTVWMVLGLASVAILRRRTPPQLLVLVLGLFSVASQAETWYVQTGFGQNRAERSPQQLNTPVGQGVIQTLDAEDSSLQLSIGYQWHPRVAIEFGYLDLGDARVAILAESLTPAQYHDLVKTVSPVLGDGYTAAARVLLWQHQDWRLEVPVGVIRWSYEINSQLGSTQLSSKDTGTDWFYGMQLSYQVTEHVLVGVGVQQLDLAPNEVKDWQLQIRYRF